MKYLFISFLLFSVFCKAQFNKDIWLAGSAQTLTGKTFILSVFISERGKPVSDTGKKEFLALQAEAEKWLIAQANVYKSDISFRDSVYNPAGDIVFDTLESGMGSGYERVDWVTRVFKKMGKQGPLDFYRWVKNHTDCSNFIVLLFAGKNGNSYSFPCSTKLDTAKYFTEGCIVYKNFNTGQALCASVIAHEILHLFAAWDLYHSFDTSKEQETRAKRIYPDDIMLRTSYTINDLNIGKLTAWRLGISDYTEEIFEWFRPTDMPKK